MSLHETRFIQFNPEQGLLICVGTWTIDNIVHIKKHIKKIPLPETKDIIIDGQGIKRFDSAGAWLLVRTMEKLAKYNFRINITNFSEKHKKLLDFFNEKKLDVKDIPTVTPLRWRAALGKYALYQLTEIHQFVNFIGKLSFEALRVAGRIRLWNWNTITSTINRTGMSALP